MKNTRINLGREGKKKSFIISLLNKIIFFNLMTKFNLNYVLILDLNSFYIISKDKYLYFQYI